MSVCVHVKEGKRESVCVWGEGGGGGKKREREKRSGSERESERA